MVMRLNRPLTPIAGPFVGPIKIGRFEDGTLLVAGPNDRPVLIRHGAAMYLAEHQDSGDLLFSYFTDEERAAFAFKREERE